MSDTTGISGTRITTMPAHMRARLNADALSTIAEALEDYADKVRDAEDGERIWWLAQVMREARTAAIDLPRYQPNGTTSSRTDAVVEEMERMGAVVA